MQEEKNEYRKTKQLSGKCKKGYKALFKTPLHLYIEIATTLKNYLVTLIEINKF